jgi:amino acid transporter
MCEEDFFFSKGTPYGIWLPILLDLGAIASITTVAVTLFIAQSRILYALAHDGLLPLIFAKVDRNRKTPWVSIVITGNYSIGKTLILKQILFSFFWRNLWASLRHLSSRCSRRNNIYWCTHYVFVHSYLSY